MRRLSILILLLLATPLISAQAAPPMNIAVLAIPLIEHKYAKNSPQVSLAFITQKSKLSGDSVFLPLAGEKTNLTLTINNNGTYPRVLRVVVKVSGATYEKTIVLLPGKKICEAFPLGALPHGARMSVEIIDLIQGLDVLYNEFFVL